MGQKTPQSTQHAITGTGTGTGIPSNAEHTLTVILSNAEYTTCYHRRRHGHRHKTRTIPNKYPPNALSLHSSGKQWVNVVACWSDANPFTVVSLLSSRVLPLNNARVHELPERGNVDNSTSPKRGPAEEEEEGEMIPHCRPPADDGKVPDTLCPSFGRW